MLLNDLTFYDVDESGFLRELNELIEGPDSYLDFENDLEIHPDVSRRTEKEAIQIGTEYHDKKSKKSAAIGISFHKADKPKEVLIFEQKSKDWNNLCHHIKKEGEKEVVAFAGKEYSECQHCKSLYQDCFDKITWCPRCNNRMVTKKALDQLKSAYEDLYSAYYKMVDRPANPITFREKWEDIRVPEVYDKTRKERGWVIVYDRDDLYIPGF